jgi:hypothetical protein
MQNSEGRIKNTELRIFGNNYSSILYSVFLLLYSYSAKEIY